MNVILGCDPGATGALAVLTTTGRLIAVTDMPAADGVVSGAGIADIITSLRNDGHLILEAWVELVTPMPKQGLGSTFKFGTAYGALCGALGACRVPVELVTPGVWKKPAGLIGKDKDASRRKALSLWPDASARFARKKDCGRAEAALIARHGLHARGLELLDETG